MILPDIAPISSSDVIAMLRRHYLPDGRAPGGVFASEIESPDGRRRADALWAPWHVNGELTGHEVKVTRSDVLVELADPMKADAWQRYCARWWLVVAHPSFVDGLDVPPAWGVMAPPSGRRTRTMTVVRQAPKLKPVDSGPAWRRIASWEHYRWERQVTDLQYRATRAEAAEGYAQAELASRQLAGEGRASAHAVKVGEVLTALERDGWRGHDFDTSDVVAAIQDLNAARRLERRTHDEIRYLIDEVRRCASPLTRVSAELEKLAKEPSERRTA